MEGRNSMEDREQGPVRDLDRAMAARLARLRDIPMDTSRLDRMFRSEIPQLAARPKTRTWLRPARALAASLAILATLGAVIIISSSGELAQASPAQMAQFHQEMVSGQVATVRVDSIEAANKVLSGQSPESPAVPELPPKDHVKACCMKSIKGKKLSCVLVEKEGTPVTMTVANAADMQLPKSPTTDRGGVTYHIQAFERLNMVMTQRNGRWICLIGELSAEKLMDLAQRLQF